MRKIAIVASKTKHDPTIQELLKEGRRFTDTLVVDPIDFKVLLNNSTNNSTTILIKDEPATNYSAFIVRGLNFKGESDFQFEVFETLEALGLPIINSTKAIQVAESKFLTSHWLSQQGMPVPPTVVTQDPVEFLEFLSAFGEAVVKPVYGFQGHGVIKITKGERGVKRRVAELMEDFPAVCVQKFLRNPGRDIRAFVVGGRVVAAIYREVAAGDWKTNISAGGEATFCRMKISQEKLAVDSARTIGLDYTGVDIIEAPDRDYVIEVNGAPAWSGVREATGEDVGLRIIEQVVKRAKYDGYEHV